MILSIPCIYFPTDAIVGATGEGSYDICGEVAYEDILQMRSTPWHPRHRGDDKLDRVGG